MKDIFKNLFKIKSLVTIALTVLFVYLGWTKVLPVETVAGVYGLVLGSLLRNNKPNKNNDDTEDNENKIDDT